MIKRKKKGYVAIVQLFTDNRFKIKVKDPDGDLVYDGMWHAGYVATIDDAFEEAWVGAGVI
jgi:hypothetical protein